MQESFQCIPQSNSPLFNGKEKEKNTIVVLSFEQVNKCWRRRRREYWDRSNEFHVKVPGPILGPSHSKLVLVFLFFFNVILVLVFFFFYHWVMFSIRVKRQIFIYNFTIMIPNTFDMFDLFVINCFGECVISCWYIDISFLHVLGLLFWDIKK